MENREHAGASDALVPTTHEIRDAFTDEIAALGGEVRDAFDDGTRLFLRAVLPAAEDVRPGDLVRGGVALRTLNDEILVHPYTFRQVCTNGAIRAHALETRRVMRAEPVVFGVSGVRTFEVLAELGEAVRACAAPDVFRDGVAEMRSAAEIEADGLIMFPSLMSRVLRADPRAGLAQTPLHQRMRQQFRARPDPDRSLFGLMNAVTAVARDTPDPELRWRLEELGGAVPLMRPRRPTPIVDAALLEV